MLIVGIDPGKTGTVAVLEDKSINKIHVMKTVDAKETNQEIKVSHEKAEAMPKNGAVSMLFNIATIDQ